MPQLSAHLHPTLRIVNFLILAGAISLGNEKVLLTTLGGLAFAYMIRPAEGLPRQLWRMRWFFLSVLVLYAWFTPGQPIAPGLWGDWLPTTDGMWEGSRQLLRVLTLIMTVSWLTQGTRKEDLVAGILGLMKPFRFLGVSGERFAVRVMLVFELVPLVQRRFHAWSEQGPKRQHVAMVSIARLFVEFLHDVETRPLPILEVIVPHGPSLKQCLGSGVLATLMLGLQFAP